MQEMGAFSGQPLQSQENISEIEGNMKRSEEGLSHTVLPDETNSENGKLVEESINNGVMGFTPDIMYAKIVNNYNTAKDLYGETLLRLLTGFTTSTLDRNIAFPEFQRELKERLNQKFQELEDEELISHDGQLTDKAVKVASLVIYSKELDRLAKLSGKGDMKFSKASTYGDKTHAREFKKGDRYADINLRLSIKKAVSRGKISVGRDDLRTSPRKSPNSATIVYGLDASASMKGDKLKFCKQAGTALAFQAINHKDKVGIVSFGTVLKTVIEPTSDFSHLLHAITAIRASTQTDFEIFLQKATEMLARSKGAKHIVLLTDALATVGEKPMEKTLQGVSAARANGITISIVGIKLDAKGVELAKKIAETGNGRFYLAKQLADLDMLVLDDYYAVSA